MAPNTESVNPKIYMQVWLCCIKNKTTITIKEQGAEDVQMPEKAHPIGEFIIVAKFSGHVLRHLASRLANVIRQGGRQTKNLVLAILKKNPYLSFYNFCMFYALYLGLVMLNRTKTNILNVNGRINF